MREETLETLGLGVLLVPCGDDRAGGIAWGCVLDSLG